MQDYDIITNEGVTLAKVFAENAADAAERSGFAGRGDVWAVPSRYRVDTRTQPSDPAGYPAQPAVPIEQTGGVSLHKSVIRPASVEGEYYLRHCGSPSELHDALLEASDYCPVNITYKDKRYTVINDMAWGKSPDLIEATRLFLGAHEGSWEDFPEFAGH